MRTYFVDEDVQEFANRAENAGTLQVGDTVRFSHKECRDMRARGYITKKNGILGRIVDLFYCHNCGSSDVRVSSRGLRSVVGATSTTPPEAAEDEIMLPDDSEVITSRDEVPAHITSWAESYGIAGAALWSPGMERIIMPVFDYMSGNLLGYQARRDPMGSTNIPKYLTVASRDRPLRLLVRPFELPIDRQSTVVITEDWISAHQFRNLPGVWGAALLGLNASAEHLLWIDRTIQECTEDAPRYIIWLDNDVKKSFEVRDYLQRLLMAIGRRSHVIGHLKDPKNVSNVVLKSAVETSFI